MIHLAGLSYWQDILHNRPSYLDRFLRTAYDDPEARKNTFFFDVLSVHVFQNTDNVGYLTQLYKHLADSMGYSKPVWIDEMNALVNSDGTWPVFSGYQSVSLDQQASFIIQGSALALAAGAERVEVYRLFDDAVKPGYEAWGLVRADGTRRPGYYALRTASEYFRNSVKVERFKNNFATMVLFRQPERTVYVIWNRTQRTAVYVHIPISKDSDSGSELRIVSQTGYERTMSSDLASSPSSDRVSKGGFELILPPCISGCDIQGEPRILVQSGAPQPITILSDIGQILPLNNASLTATVQP